MENFGLERLIMTHIENLKEQIELLRLHNKELENKIDDLNKIITENMMKVTEMEAGKKTSMILTQFITNIISMAAGILTAITVLK